MINYKNKQRPEKDMIFGIRAVLEAIESGKEIDKILVRRDMTNDLSRELFAALNGLEVPVQKVPIEKLNRITMKNHQGVIAFISPVAYQHIEDIIPSIYEAGRMPFIVVLDGVTDVRNFGAIARTCECAGVDAIVVPLKGGAALNGDAVKTSAGALLKIPVCREHNLTNTLKYLSSSGIKLVAATEKASENYTQTSMSGPVAIVMGSEEDGVSPENLRLCDGMVRIPLLGTIESLNVSVAAGILIYEAVRQRTVVDSLIS
ncbi:MAG: 23S rRNA (guanosine(2251)-2'-O)-methyltransferase RlmB [Paludibacter sp.]